MILLLFAFTSGLVTIAAPCIWPLLPIVLSASSTGGNKKPLGITLGILLSFGILTLSLSYIVKILPINLDLLRLFAVVVLISLGLSLIIPKFSAILESYVSKFSGKIGSKNRSGFVGGLLTGITLGIVWTPCAGPILATIATLAATTRVNSQIILITIFYLIGVGVPLFLFSIIGRNILTKTKFFSKYTVRIQQVFGTIMILTALLIFTNEDKVLAARLLDFFPSYTNSINKFESKSGVNNLTNNKNNQLTNSSNLLPENIPAPEFAGITKWLNTNKDLTLKELRGKVVLVDFWTYTCINCIRTLPHVTSWYDTYKDKNFVVIGVHTPEFEFEKDTNNVSDAIKRFNIHYPVAQDNDYGTWSVFQNQYWPAEYLIDAEGVIRRVHFGEGEYDQTEEAIQQLIKETGVNVSSTTQMPDQTPTQPNSPETYVGSKRMQYFFPNNNIASGIYDLTLSTSIPINSFSLGGNWNIQDEFSKVGENGVLEYNFTANKVYLVMRKGGSKTGIVKVFLDGKLTDNSFMGTDVRNGLVTVDSDKLYNLIDLKGKAGNHLLRLELEKGIEVFAFTFG